MDRYTAMFFGGPVPNGRHPHQPEFDYVLPSPARLFEQLLRGLWPPSGRHRQSAATPAAPPAPAPRHAPEYRRQPHTCALRGEDNTLVRPYLTAHNAHAMQVTA
ncbi:hypothetical protein [Streptomyces sp. NPDC003015]